MSFTPWQPLVITDRLLELGPSTQDHESAKYSYLEFQNAGRVRNVVAFADLQSKLDGALGVEGFVFHMVSGQHTQTGDVSNALIALGSANGPVYGIDLNVRGSADAIAEFRKVQKTGKLMQWGGAALLLIGIPLVLALVGIFLVGGGYVLWRSGKKMSQGMKYQIEMFEQCSLVLSRIPGVRLV